MKALVEWTAIDFLARHIVGLDKPSYVPSAATGTVMRRPPNRITRAVPGSFGWDSKRRNRSSHCHRRHKCRYRQHQKYASHRRYLLNLRAGLVSPAVLRNKKNLAGFGREGKRQAALFYYSIHRVAEKRN